MAKGILEGKDKIAAAYPGAKKLISREGGPGGNRHPLHPGARKYFEETQKPWAGRSAKIDSLGKKIWSLSD